jgi:WD40 repeat protein
LRPSRWNWTSGECESSLRGHDDAVTALRAWADETLLSASYDSTVRGPPAILKPGGGLSSL